MTITLTLRELSSRVVRERLTQNSAFPGVREIVASTVSNSNQNLSFFDRLKSFGGKTINVVGWIIGKVLIPGGISFVNLLGAAVQAGSFIYNFDWNISDRQIDAKFESLKLIMAGYAGEVLGSAVGYLVCGVLPSAAIMSFNEPLGYYLLKEVGEEALDEFASNMAAFLNFGFRATAATLTYTAFKNTRKAIKLFTSPSNPRRRQLAEKIFGNRLVKAIDQWGEENSKPWSFRTFFEGQVESIEDPLQREFTEEFTEEFADACVEAGYIVATGLDTWVLQQQSEQEQQQQEQSIIEIQPNRDVPNETFIFQGSSSDIRTQAINALNNYNVMEARDVGAWVGEPLVDSIRKPPKDIAITILFRGASQPPWKNPDGSRAKRTQITIPNVIRSKIDWRKIKKATGSLNGYLWGNHWVQAILDDGNKIEFYAANETEGEQVLDNLLDFTNAELLTLNIQEEKRKGARKKYDQLFKRTTRVYPAHLVVVNQIKLLTQDRGKATTRGYKEHRQLKFPLYTNDKPLDFDESIEVLFTPSF